MNLQELLDWRICDSFRKKRNRLPKLPFLNEDNVEISGSRGINESNETSSEKSGNQGSDNLSSSDSSSNVCEINKEKINMSLIAIGQTPAKKRKLEQNGIPMRNFSKYQVPTQIIFFTLKILRRPSKNQAKILFSNLSITFTQQMP